MECKMFLLCTYWIGFISFCAATGVKEKAKIEDFKLVINPATTKRVVDIKPNMARLTVYPNDTLDFSCTASGSNGTYVAISQNGFQRKRSILTKGKLVSVGYSLPRADCSHAGQYVCKTGNILGHEDVAINVVVECLTPNARFHPEDKGRYFASSKGLQGPTLTCTETSLDSSIFLSIQRDDGEVLSRIEDATLVNYTFGIMQCSDTGTYLCVAESKTKSRTTTQILDISVNGCPPKMCRNVRQAEIEEDEPLPFSFQICLTIPYGPNLTAIYVNNTWIFLGECYSGICFSYLNRVSKLTQLINLTITNETSQGALRTTDVRIGSGYNFKENYIKYRIGVLKKESPRPNNTVSVGASVYTTTESSLMLPVVISISSIAGVFVLIAAVLIYLYRGKIKYFQLKLSRRCYNTADGLYLGASSAENPTNKKAVPSAAIPTHNIDTSVEHTSTTDKVHETRASVVPGGGPTVSVPLTSRIPDTVSSPLTSRIPDTVSSPLTSRIPNTVSPLLTSHTSRLSDAATFPPTSRLPEECTLPMNFRLPDVAYSHQNVPAAYGSMTSDNLHLHQSLNSPTGETPYGSPFYGNPAYVSPAYGSLRYGSPAYTNVPQRSRPPDVVFESPDGRISRLPLITEALYEPENGTVTYITRSPDVSVRYSSEPPPPPVMDRRGDDMSVNGVMPNMTYIPDVMMPNMTYNPDVMMTNMTYNPDGTMSSLAYNPDGTMSSLAYNLDGTVTTVKHSPNGEQVNLPFGHDEKLNTLPYEADGTVVNLPYSPEGASQPQVHHTQNVYQVTTTINNNNQFTDSDGVVYVTTGNTQVIKKTERVIHEEIRETMEFVNLDYIPSAAKPDVTYEETQNEANRTYEEQQNIQQNR